MAGPTAPQVTISYLAGAAQPVQGILVRTLHLSDEGTGWGAGLAERLDFDRGQNPTEAHAAGGSTGDGNSAPFATATLSCTATDRVQLSMPGGATREFAPEELGPEVLGRLCALELQRPDLGAGWFHGAALRSGQRTVVLLGTSGAGKSTLAAHLCALGWQLISDEQFAVDPDTASVVAFTRPLLLKPGSFAHAPDRLELAGSATALVRPEELGTSWALDGAPTEIYFLDRSDAASTTATVTTTSLGQAAAAHRLLENSLDVGRHPERALRSSGRLVTAAAAMTLHYQESADAARFITDTAVGHPRPPDDEFKVSSAHVPVGADGFQPHPAMLTLTLDDGTVLLHGGDRTVLRLNPEGTAVWRDLPRSRRDLNEAEVTFLDELVTLGVATEINEQRADRRRRLGLALNPEIQI
jgi:energy-coupling factor transporter ATP-binding protein EcfA2